MIEEPYSRVVHTLLEFRREVKEGEVYGEWCLSEERNFHVTEVTLPKEWSMPKWRRRLPSTFPSITVVAIIVNAPGHLWIAQHTIMIWFSPTYFKKCITTSVSLNRNSLDHLLATPSVLSDELSKVEEGTCGFDNRCCWYVCIAGTTRLSSSTICVVLVE